MTVTRRTEVPGRKNFRDVVLRFMEKTEEQAKWIAKYKKDGDRQFTEDGRVAEIDHS